MNRRNEMMIGFFSVIGLAILILDGKTALEGARDGVELCLNTLIPTLLPFFFLSNILTTGLMGRKIGILRPLGRLCSIPEGAEYILLTGFLGGYPLGAQCICQACTNGTLSHQDGRRMLAFCNNCGPAFLFGVSGALFQDPRIPWMLFAIHVVSSLLVAVLIPGEPGVCSVNTVKKPSAVQALWQSIRSVAGVCGWVILFRTALAMLEIWFMWYLPKEMQVIMGGVLELSNGCISLECIENTQLRFILCSGFLAFGGLCVTMQTYCAAYCVDRTLYFPGKVMQTAISLALACLICKPKWAVYPGLVATVLGIFLRKTEIRCRNQKKLVV